MPRSVWASLPNRPASARFVYASSQSMYGVSKIDAELDEDDSEKHPVTAYARTKWEAELALKQLGGPDFTVVCMRPSTAFGASARLRCDIVFNNLVACAYTTGRIEIKSDGTPWRPVVHVRDIGAAFIAGLEAPAELVANRSYNVGIPNGNFSVRDLAEAAGRAVPGCTVVYTGEHGSDARTYRVSFTRILNELRDWYRPEWDLDRGGAELVALFKSGQFLGSRFPRPQDHSAGAAQVSDRAGRYRRRVALAAQARRGGGGRRAACGPTGGRGRAMKFTELGLAGVWLIEPNPHCDERGVFRRHFCAREFEEHGLAPMVAQANVSENPTAGTLRGFHYQLGPLRRSQDDVVPHRRRLRHRRRPAARFGDVHAVGCGRAVGRGAQQPASAGRLRQRLDHQGRSDRDALLRERILRAVGGARPPL